MKISRALLSVALAGLAAWPVRVNAQTNEPASRALEAMRAAAGVELLVTRSPRTQLATFVSAPQGRSIPVPDRLAATPEARALSFVAVYGRAFGLRGGRDVQISRLEHDTLGIDHVRMRQAKGGVPVTGGEIIVHLRGSEVLSANGKTLADLDAVSIDPTLAAFDALGAARRLVSDRLNAADAELSEPRLEIFNHGMLNGRDFPTRLAWFVEARGFSLREFIWVDANNGVVLLHFSQIADAKDRKIYNGNSTATLPGPTLMRSEGGPATGDADADAAYDYSGSTYDYYFTNHGRDSFDGAGGQIRSTVHHCEPGDCPMDNAYWDGTQMVYGDGFSRADDVVGHELTHAVTEKSANLFYYMQAGALNESFSDIFGETIDLTNGLGNDAAGVRWKLGEDLTGGAIRDMRDPTVFGDPGKMSDSQFKCEIDAFQGDAGGVHTNSGVPNHAYELMVDGTAGVPYNGFTIAGIGLTKAAKIQYRALTQYLTSGSDFLDNYNALQQSCADLVGTAGITLSDCSEVKKALDAVQMSNALPCTPAQAASPALCSAGQHPVNSFFDDFEGGLGAWTRSGPSGTWALSSAPSLPSLGAVVYATSGLNSLWGFDIDTAGDSIAALANNLPTIPTNARLQFDHSFGFDQDSRAFDGGVIEYSTNGAGGPWTDASPLFQAGANYNGNIVSGFGNPLAGRSAFVRNSWGYTASQYNLGILAGLSSVRFRFRLGSDSSTLIEEYGWFIDDFRVYQCVADVTPSVTTDAATGVTSGAATLNGTVNPGGFATTAFFDFGPTASYGTQIVVTPPPGSGVGGVPISAPVSGLACGTTYHFRAKATSSAVTNTGADATFTTPACPLLSVDDVSVVEGNSGTISATFTVSLSATSTQTVTVSAATSSVTALAGTDFTTTGPLTLTFAPGITSLSFVVPVIGDTVFEPNETFSVNLSSPTNAVLLKPTGTGTIQNDDPSVVATTVTQYRLYHPFTKEHLYTTDLNEYTVLGTQGWTQEGIAYKMLTNGLYNGVSTVPLYRLYHVGILQHLWTTDANETTVLATTGGWTYEGIIGYLLPTPEPGTTPLYRMALPFPPLHLWTTDLNEYTVLQGPAWGWLAEGAIGHVVP